MAGSTTIGILRVLLTANSAQFDAAMKQASTSAKAWSKDLTAIGTQASTIGASLTRTLTLPILALGVGASKAAIDFESSFAGVRKTVDATEAEFVQMEQAFRDLAKTIPVSVNELNRLGEAAGALGIPKAEIVDFSRVMALLGVTTNVTADEAASSIAKIQNIFGAAGVATENFASTLVDLGNHGASTEQEILSLATRIASAGNAIGLTQGQVLGFSSAIANVGIEAEAGGSAISRVFADIGMAVSKGGDGLAEFAKIAGLSVSEFSTLFKTDAAGAVTAFVEGLGRVKTSGGDLIGTIDALGFSELRQANLLRALAQSGDNLRTSLDLQGVAWKANTALADEAGERFKTTASQLALLWNKVTDVGITLGNALLPSINLTIRAFDAALPILESFAKAFAALPASAQAIAIGFGLAVAAIGPMLFIFGQLVIAAGAVIGAFTTKGIATRALTVLVAENTVATTANTAAATANAAAQGGAGVAAAGRLTAALGLLGKAALVTGAAIGSWKIGTWIGEITGLSDAYGRLSARLFEGLGLLPRGTAAQYDTLRAAQEVSKALTIESDGWKGLTAATQAQNAVMPTMNELTKIGRDLDLERARIIPDVTSKTDQLRMAVAALSETTKSDILERKAQGATVQELSKEFNLGKDVITAFFKSQQSVTQGAKDATNAFNEWTDAMAANAAEAERFNDQIGDAFDLMLPLARLPKALVDGLPPAIAGLGTLAASMANVGNETQAADVQVGLLTGAYARLGLTTPAELQRIADAAVRDFGIVRDSGTATPLQIQAAFETMRDAVHAANGTIPTQWETEIRPRIMGALAGLQTDFSNTLAEMLTGQTGWKDGAIGIWESFKSAVTNILSSLLNTFTNTFLRGLMNALTGAQGGFAGAFAGLFSGLGGAGGFGAGGVEGVAAIPGIAGLFGGGGGAGAAGSAGLFGLSGAATAGIGAAILGGFMLVSHLLKPSEESQFVSPKRDEFLQSFESGGSNAIAGVSSLADALTRITGIAGGGPLMDAIFQADTVKEYEAAVRAVELALKDTDAQRILLAVNDPFPLMSANGELAAKTLTESFISAADAGKLPRDVIDEMNKKLEEAMRIGPEAVAAIIPELIELAAQGGLSTQAILDLVGALDGLSAHDRSVANLVSQFSGTQVFEDAQVVMDAIAEMGGIADLTDASLANVHDTLGRAIEQYEALGQTAPQAMYDLWKQTSDVKDVTELVSEATQELMDKRDGLMKSIENEAPEEVMGSIEQGIRDQIAALDDQIAKTTELTTTNVDGAADATGATLDAETAMGDLALSTEKAAARGETAFGDLRNRGIQPVEKATLDATSQFTALGNEIVTQSGRGVLALKELYGWTELVAMGASPSGFMGIREQARLAGLQIEGMSEDAIRELVRLYRQTAENADALHGLDWKGALHGKDWKGYSSPLADSASGSLTRPSDGVGSGGGALTVNIDTINFGRDVDPKDQSSVKTGIRKVAFGVFTEVGKDGRLKTFAQQQMGMRP